MIFQELLEKAPKLKIAVIGDYIIDKYIFGSVDRISPEAPVPVVVPNRTFTRPGGAGNVVKNLLNIGVDAYLFTTGDRFHELPRDVVFYHPGEFPKKTRVISGTHHLLRMDEESVFDVVYDDVLWKEDFEVILRSLDAVVFSDYHKGVINPTVSNTIIAMCNEKGIPVIVDAKKDFDKYTNATILKCNQKEAQNINPIIERSNLCLNYFVVTCGENGISWFTDSGNGVDGIPVDIVDVCGAGDTVTAILAASYAAGFNIQKSITLANIAAAETCKHIGVYPITKEDLLRL